MMDRDFMMDCHRLFLPVLCVLLVTPPVQVQDQSFIPEFVSTPTSVNVTLGSTATFSCSSIGLVTWQVNGSQLSELNAPDISENLARNTFFLHIPATEECNNTVVVCSVAIIVGEDMHSDPALLRVQGTLAPVGELTAVPKEGFLHLTWNPPFTLNITNIEPDIYYCINVYNITPNSLYPLKTLCDLTQPEFDFTVANPIPCDQFQFQVIPVNDAGNGTLNSISASLFYAPVLQNAPAAEVAVDPDGINVIFFFSETFHICVWRLHVNSSDDLPVISLWLPDIPAWTNATGFNITIRSDTLPFDRNYSIAIEGENSAGRALTPKFRLSTYDVQETILALDPVIPGRLTVTCVFASNSSALGCLCIIRRQSTAVESFHVIKQPNNTASIEGLNSDNYTVLTFDIERNGLPGNRAAYLEEFEIQNGSEMELGEHSADTVLAPLNNGTLCLPCNSTSECVVLLHSTSKQQHLGVHTTNFTQGANRTCVNASTCSRTNCTVAVYEQSTDGVIDHPEPVFTAFAAIPEIISSPKSVNATLGSTATFNCSITTGVVAWILNGSLLSVLNAADITAEQVENIFVLHVPATEEYNNTNVTCALAILGGEDLFSDPVILKVQGLLDAVTNLKSKFLCQNFRLTWDAPFSLDITGVDPDIWYQVDITEAGAPLSTFSITRVVNISEFNFTRNEYRDTSSSVIYEFQVTPINGAGDGRQSDLITGYFTGPPRRITAEMIVVEISAHPLNVNFTIAYGRIPPGEMPDRFQVHAETSDDENTVRFCTDDIPVTPGLNGNVFIQLNPSTPTCTHRSNSLKAYRKYNATITAKNGCGENNSTGEILFSTHEVQRCDVNSHSRPGTVNIKCKFTMKSDALGYLPILSSKTNLSHEIFVVATRDDFSSSDLNISIPGVPQDNYNVTVFDLDSNGLPPVLAGEINYFADEQSTIVTNAEQAGTDESFSVGGIFLEVPKSTNTSTKVMLCVSFESSTNKEMIVLLAHRYGIPQKLLAYYLNTTNCTPAPDAGRYVVGVFNQTGGSILKAPATPPNISIITPADIAPVTPTPTVIDQTPFPGDLAVGSTLTVTLLVTVTVVVTILVVAVCLRTKRRRAGMRVSTDSGDHSPSKNSSQNVEITTYKHIEEEVLKILPDPGDEVKGKTDGTPGLPGSSGTTRLKVCQHRTHDDSGTAPGTAGIPGPAEDSDDSGITPNNAGIPGPAEDSPPRSYYTGEKPRRFYQKNRSHQHQMFSRTGQTAKFADSIPQAQPKNLWMEGENDNTGAEIEELLMECIEDEHDNTGAKTEGDAASVSSKPPVLTETATDKPPPHSHLKRRNTVPLLMPSIQDINKVIEELEDIEDKGHNTGVGIQDHLMRPQSASEEKKHRDTHSNSKAKLHELLQPTHPNFVWDDSDTV